MPTRGKRRKVNNRGAKKPNSCATYKGSGRINSNKKMTKKKRY